MKLSLADIRRAYKMLTILQSTMAGVGRLYLTFRYNTKVIYELANPQLQLQVLKPSSVELQNFFFG